MRATRHVALLVLVLAGALLCAVCGESFACGGSGCTASATGTISASPVVVGNSAGNGSVTITLSASGTGIADVSISGPSSNDCGSNTYCQSTWSPVGQAGGTYTWTGTVKDACDDVLWSGSVSVTVIGLSAPTDTLWWFNGATPGNYAISCTVTANAPSGPYSWSVSGAQIVSLSNQTCTTVTVTSTGQSSSPGNDVSINYTWNGTATASVRLTVLSPSMLDWVNDPYDNPWDTGYLSDIWYEVRDQFEVVLPNAVPMNETFGAETKIWYDSGFGWEDWGLPATTYWDSGNDNPHAFIDFIGSRETGKHPAVENPHGPPWTAVQSWPQKIRVGTTVSGNGKQTTPETIERWTDHGR